MSHRLTTTAIRTAVVASALAATAGLSVLPAVASAPAAPAAPVVAAPVVPAAHTVPTAPAAPAAAARSSALQNALGKIGAPYRWGASGPSAFDCSGLVKWAFEQEGISLPRTSRAMASAGTPVSKSALAPGDIVTFYRPVSHVGIYVGNGQVVHASTSGSPVKTSSMDAMPFNSARRV
ncbi:NlpC/P60 family protein [Pseudonocardia endophytica]|uniref:Cell wall-associated NlpC family hydrolase n=1 Tax=Pseudonocardia endophytica TaxID=401976 RepID=A0A4R1IB94_PSEEN|nr:NlpC/P60 family protein [Pseudonocardia endophytica]TCK27692.1 cell wall-associated NlpC family hydrolase [Pseudonocardia endophytica]